MNQQEIDQILNMIKNFEEKRAYIPYFSDLASNPALGPVFQSLADHEKQAVKDLINDYITEKINWMTKTKWGQLFKRFFDSTPDLFWDFRNMNDPIENDSKFQETGKKVEQEMFRLEGILTEKMVGQEKWLDKVVWSFYNIVYSFFPKFNDIE